MTGYRADPGRPLSRGATGAFAWATGTSGSIPAPAFRSDRRHAPEPCPWAWSSCFVFLAFDGRLHWDEAAYLYTGGFLDREAILEGEFIGGLYISRLLHIATIAAIVDLVGPGPSALAILIGVYFAALLLVARLAYLILRKVLSDARGLGVAVICGMFTPIYLYLAFKTVAEIPGLALSSIAAWALLSAFTGRPLIWLPVVSLALAATALFKPETTLLYVSLAATLLLFGPDRYPRRRLIGYVLVSGLGALAVFAAALWLLGIDLALYLKMGMQLPYREEPLVAKLLSIALEGGIFFAAVPLAFLSSRRRDVWFCLTWFLLATLPIPLLSEHVESRFLAPNLMPLIGLIYLAADGLAPRVVAWWRRSRAVTACVAGLALLIVVGSNLIALSVMTHELRIDQLHRLIARLDQTYANRNYAILTPYTYTDFHYLRFAYPERPIYTVQTVFRPAARQLELLSKSRHHRPCPAESARRRTRLSRLSRKSRGREPAADRRRDPDTHPRQAIREEEVPGSPRSELDVGPPRPGLRRAPARGALSGLPGSASMSVGLSSPGPAHGQMAWKDPQQRHSHRWNPLDHIQNPAQLR